MEIIDPKVANEESVKYFDGDTLAATTWINKYALRDGDGNLLEKTPKDMHDRIVDEVYRIEQTYPNPVLTKELLHTLIDNFRYVIPGGSVMSGIGNKYKYTSLSNCFVIDSPVDSYGGIMLADQELVQLMKRRGGVGQDLSELRPAQAKVTNDARTSSGLVSFMERYSNTTRECAQNGRRGALMLSVSIKHPDAEGFIDAKMTDGKVTGANISVKLTDEFMQAVESNSIYAQTFPITEKLENIVDVNNSGNFELNGKQLEVGVLYEGKKSGTYIRVIEAKKLWNKIIFNAWKSAEPGLLFWDNIISESPSDFYSSKGYRTVSTNPCGEIPLCPYDSCRLISLNLYNFVNNPFTSKAEFDFNKLSNYSFYTQRIMDNIIDIEAEHIRDIIHKIESDPESYEVKRVELDLWKKIQDKTLNGRRTGVGFTALGDTLSALGVPYGSKDGIALSEKIAKTISIACYESSIEMARERGAFKVWSRNELSDLDKTSKFINRIFNELPDSYKKSWKKTGRRNISMLTCAPTGTVSLMSRTTSGIEPLFKAWYIRRRKTNDKNKAVFTDNVGDMFEEFKVFHPKFIDYIRIADPNYDFKNNQEVVEYLNNCSESELKEIYEKSPWYKSTAQDINWVDKVKVQGDVQKWIDHSISCTVNVPKETTEAQVADIYMAAWKSRCKGVTIYRDGSRDGVLITKSTTVQETSNLNKPRPESLHAKIFRFKNGSENWIAFIGMMNNQPYECFCGRVDDDVRYLPKSVLEGEIIRVENNDELKTHRYDFKYKIRFGYENTLPAISEVFKSEYWNYAKFVSSMLRAGVPMTQVINTLESLNSDMGDTINTWKRGVSRALRNFIKDGEKSGKYCEKCGAELVYQGGCRICMNCGDTKCE